MWLVSPCFSKNIKSVSRQPGRYQCLYQCLTRLDPVSGSFEGDIHIFSGTLRHKNARYGFVSDCSEADIGGNYVAYIVHSQTVRNTFSRCEDLQIIVMKYCLCHVCDSCSGNRFRSLSDSRSQPSEALAAKKERSGAVPFHLCSPVYHTKQGRYGQIFSLPGDGPGHCQIAGSLVVHPFFRAVYGNLWMVMHVM